MKHYGAVEDPKDLTTKEYVDTADAVLKVKVDALWDAIFVDITANPFQILEGVTVTTGVWNESYARLEC